MINFEKCRFPGFFSIHILKIFIDKLKIFEEGYFKNESNFFSNDHKMKSKKNNLNPKKVELKAENHTSPRSQKYYLILQILHNSEKFYY